MANVLVGFGIAEFRLKAFGVRIEKIFLGIGSCGVHEHESKPGSGRTRARARTPLPLSAPLRLRLRVLASPKGLSAVSGYLNDVHMTPVSWLDRAHGSRLGL
jgi:hypothetical protein